MRYLSAAALTVTIIGSVAIAEAQTGWTGTVTTISAPAPTLGYSRPAIADKPNGNAYVVWNNVGAGPTSKPPVMWQRRTPGTPDHVAGARVTYRSGGRR